MEAYFKSVNDQGGIHGRKLTLMEEARTIAEMFWGDDSEPIIIEKPDIPNHIDSFYYDISKAKP